MPALGDRHPFNFHFVIHRCKTPRQRLLSALTTWIYASGPS